MVEVLRTLWWSSFTTLVPGRILDSETSMRFNPVSAMASRNSSRLLLLGLGGWIALLTASCGSPGDSPPARELAKADPNCPLSGAQKKKAVKAFEAMMPVFRHPQCSNCHGGIDPSKAEGGHLGGKIEPVTRRADPKNNYEDMNMERKPGDCRGPGSYH